MCKNNKQKNNRNIFFDRKNTQFQYVDDVLEIRLQKRIYYKNLATIE